MKIDSTVIVSILSSNLLLAAVLSENHIKQHDKVAYSFVPFESKKVQANVPKRQISVHTDVTSPSVFISNQLNVTQEHLALLEPNKNIFNWVFGAFGFKPQPQPEQMADHQRCQSCQCGMSYKLTRIVGGVETEINMYPWIVMLTYNSRFYCGASVISDRYILTAAHCTSGFTKERLVAHFLRHDRSINESQSFTRGIKNIIRHRQYQKDDPFNNDIALLEVDSPLQFNDMFRPVCLPSSGRSFTGETGVVIGWGATAENGPISSKLREVEVPILSNEDCKKTGYGRRITDNMLCAGYLTGQKDSCQGDSGGPLHVHNGTLYSVVGVVSWGEGCAKPNYPGVYTRVNRFLSWITSNTKNSCYCN